MIQTFGKWTPLLDQCSFVADNSTVIGQVTAKKNSSLWYQSVIRGDLAPILIGEASNIQELVSIHVGRNAPVWIGDFVTIGHGAILHGCVVGNNTLIGMGSIILDHAKIGNNSLVGAGALVTEGKVFPDGCLIIGSPARVVRPLSEMEIKAISESAEEYVILAKENHKSMIGEKYE